MAFRILVALDFSPPSVCSLDHAVAWAVRTPCELHLLHVVESGGGGDLAFGFAELGRVVENRRRALAADGRVAAVERHLVLGAPAEEIVATAARLGADLVVMGRGGVVADAVRRHATCPVLFVTAGDTPPPIPSVRRVVCPVGRTPCARAAGVTAARLARLHGAELVMLHVLPEPSFGEPPDVEQLLGELRRDLELAGELEVRVALARGAAALDVAQRLRTGDAELLVVGACDSDPGHVAALGGDLVRSARCPIVAVPPGRGVVYPGRMSRGSGPHAARP